MTTYYGAIEGGGTKFVCAVGTGDGELLAEERFPTTLPDETIRRVIDFFKRQTHPLKAIGIATFGPVDLRRDSPTYGFITHTPKPHWTQTNLRGPIAEALGIPAAFDTDVNAAALGEATFGASRGVGSSIYITIGTGIGGGILINGELVHGLIHPEVGHMLLPHNHEQDPFPGGCPFHQDCFEGLASGPALKKRWGAPAETLPVEHPAWDLEANYIAKALASLICCYSPERIILGGGVMEQAHLFPLIRTKVPKVLNGYIPAPQILTGIDTYIVAPQLGKHAGVKGAIALASREV
jgi:fructokinase